MMSSSARGSHEMKSSRFRTIPECSHLNQLRVELENVLMLETSVQMARRSATKLMRDSFS